MVKRLLFACAAFSLVACGTTDSTKVNDQQNQPADSVLTPASETIDATLKNKFGAEQNLPFSQDSATMDINITEAITLTAEEVHFLSDAFTDLDVVPGSAQTIDDFFGLDSLHRDDEMAVWETNDGFLYIYCMANAEALVKLDDSTQLLLWAIQYYSAPGMSPHASGAILYASVLSNNVVTDCMAVGGETYSTDAPYWSEFITYVSLSAAGYRSEQVIRDGGDFDEAGNDQITESQSAYVLTLANGKWSATASAE